jgi:hypothetical protein
VDDFIENSDQPDYSVNADLFEELELDKYDSASARNQSSLFCSSLIIIIIIIIIK